MRGRRPWMEWMLWMVMCCCCGCRSVESLFPRLAAKKAVAPTPVDEAAAQVAKSGAKSQSDPVWATNSSGGNRPVDSRILERKGIEPGSKAAEKLAGESHYFNTRKLTAHEREVHGIAIEGQGLRAPRPQDLQKLE